MLCEIKVAVYLCKLPCKIFIHRLSKRNIFWVRGSWFFFQWASTCCLSFH